jgi:hypothetical protein
MIPAILVVLPRSACVLVAIALCAAFPASAQTGLTGGVLEGRVRDESGQPLAGVSVEAVDEQTGVSHRGLCSDDGVYALHALPVGSYRLRVELAGFQPLVRDSLVVGLGQVLRVDVALAPAFAESTSVDSRDEDVGLASSVSTIVGARAIEGLPANGRDYVGFSLLTPAVVAEPTPPTGPTVSSGLSFVGQRSRANHVLVDGFDNDEIFTGGVAASFSQEAVLEFQVLAAGAPAEFGHAAGGTVNTVTRSGSNDVHGGAYVFLRDDALNAREHFEKVDVFGQPVNVPKAPFRQTQWGASLGGPVTRNRTFFFLSYEQLDRDASAFVTIEPLVAQSLERQGFPIDLGRVPAETSTNSALARLDHAFSPDHRLLLRAHFSRRDNDDVGSFGGITARSDGVTGRRRDFGVSIGQTDVFGSRWLNEARLQVVHGDQWFYGLDPNCGAECRTPDAGGPLVILPGAALAGRQLNTPQHRGNVSLQAADTLTHVRGRHTLKAGFDAEVVWREMLLAQDFGGRFAFAPLPVLAGLTPRPLTALEAFEAGLPAFYFQGYGDPAADGISSAMSLFASDEWRLTPRLTLGAGLRYQRYDVRLPTQRVSGPAGPIDYEVPASGDLGPRLSISFDPTGRGRTTLRASAGTYVEDALLAIPLVSEIIDGESVRLLQARLPVSAAAWSAPGHRLPEPAAAFPSLVQVAGPGFRAPFTRQLGVGVAQELGRGLRLSVDFIAARAKDQIGVLDFNPLVPSLGPGRRPNDVDGRPGTSASVNQFTNYGEGWYQAVAVSLRKRMGSRFEGLASYTNSSADDTVSDMFGQANVAEDAGLGRDLADVAGLPLGFDPSGFRGPAAVDQRHRFVLSGLLNLPWRLALSGIVTAGSGRPFTALAGADVNGDGVSANDRARRDPQDPGSRAGRGAERMAATASLDARLSRRFPLSRGASVEAIVEGFNLSNRVNYAEVNNVFGTGPFPDQPQRDAQGRVTYGRFTKAYPPRQVQLALRLQF